MVSSDTTPVPKCRKRRRSDRIHIISDAEKNTKTAYSFIVTALLATFSVVVRGESQTPNHYHLQQQNEDIDSESMDLTVEHQQIRHKTKWAAYGESQYTSQDGKNGGKIISSLFEQSGDEELEGAHPVSYTHLTLPTKA